MAKIKKNKSLIEVEKKKHLKKKHSQLHSQDVSTQLHFVRGVCVCVRGVCVRAYPDVSILVVFGKVKHVIESHHAWRNLGKIHGWIDMILGKHKYRATLNTHNWLLIVSLCHFMLSQPRINKNKVCKNITSSVFSCWGRKNTLIKYFQNKLITAITVSNIYMLEQHKVPPVTICM